MYSVTALTLSVTGLTAELANDLRTTDITTCYLTYVTCRLLNIMNLVDRARARHKGAQAYIISSSKYKNLRLKKKGEGRREVLVRRLLYRGWVVTCVS